MFVDVVGLGGAGAIDGQLDVDDHRLLDAPLPLDEADDAFDLQAAKEDAVANNGVRHEELSLG